MNEVFDEETFQTRENSSGSCSVRRNCQTSNSSILLMLARFYYGVIADLFASRFISSTEHFENPFSVVKP